MPQGKKYTAEQIICNLREAEITTSEGKAATLAAKQISITYLTYCRWRKECGGLRADQAK